jgi:hypothetical protein
MKKSEKIRQLIANMSKKKDKKTDVDASKDNKKDLGFIKNTIKKIEKKNC